MKRGLTLLETLIALIILSILVVLIIPSLRYMTAENRLRNAADDLYHNMQYLKAKAGAEQLIIYARFTPGKNWCYGFNKNSPCDCRNLATCDLGGKQSTSYKKISLATSGFHKGNLAAGTVKNISDPSGTVTFTSGANSITLRVSPHGSITLCSPTIIGYDRC